MNTQKSISLDERLWKRIDKIRGEVPRSKFLANVIDLGVMIEETERDLLEMVEDERDTA